MFKNKTVYLQKYFYYSTLLIYVMVTIAGWFGISADTTRMSFDKLVYKQEITGGGTSGCWWAQKLG